MMTCSFSLYFKTKKEYKYIYICMGWQTHKTHKNPYSYPPKPILMVVDMGFDEYE